MLTKADDYPIHQTPDPVAFVGSDRNFYDRYFFNGYSEDGEVFFGAALGVYPNLNIMDAAFGVRIGGVQYNLHASRHLGMERMDTDVGPIGVEVLEPLKRLRVTVRDNEHGIAADLVFEARHEALQEPRMTRRHGPRVLMDFTRLTQLGRYTGWIRAGGREIDTAKVPLIGTRDRSWGVRLVGQRDPQPMVPPQPAQFHWYWVPAHLEDRVIHFYVNEDGAGDVWNAGLAMAFDDGRIEHLHDITIEAMLNDGTRWPRHASVTAKDARGGVYRIEVDAGPRFYLSGLGYFNPDWGHGHNKGPLAIGYDEIHAADVSRYEMPFIHAEAHARLTLTAPDGQKTHGIGTFETLSMGPNARRGLSGLVDAP